MKPSGGAKTESWFAPLKKGFQNMHQWAPKQNSNRILPRKHRQYNSNSWLDHEFSYSCLAISSGYLDPPHANMWLAKWV